jgi:hypothetical protein
MEIYLIAKNNFKRSLTHKTRFIVGLVLPIILCFVAGIIHTDSKANIRVGVLNNEAIVKTLEKAGGFQAALADEDTYHTDLIMGKYQVVIGKDMSIVSVNNSKVEAYYQTLIDQVLQGKKVDTSIRKHNSLSKEDRSIAFIMTLFLVMATINGATLIKDKQVGTYNRCLQIMERRRNYVLGNYVFNLLITLFQVFIALGLMSMIQKNSIGWFAVLVLSLFISVVVTIYATMLCLLCKSDVQANISASSLASILSIIGGTFIAVKNMPLVLQYISVISPIRWVLEVSRFL